MKDWEYDLAWYRAPQLSWPAAIRLQDCAGRTIENERLCGSGFNGFGIVLHRCRNIRIRRCTILGFYYAVYAIDCEDIVIEEDCDFRHNFDRPDTGWIFSPDPALQGDYHGWGGGVYFRNVRGGGIYGAALGKQFNGIDLVACAGVSIVSNTVVRTSNYAIHLWGSHRCVIQDNDCRWAIRHTPRFQRDTADSAAVLVEGGSCNNRIIHNDLRYSGDGLFIRDLTQPSAPSNGNYIARNDCSHSPNNAIEVVFSQGNVLEENEASYSHYGMWLDYSTELELRGNRVVHNEGEGLHIKRGFFKHFAGNRVCGNPLGLKAIETPVEGCVALNTFTQNGTDVVEEKESSPSS